MLSFLSETQLWVKVWRVEQAKCPAHSRSKEVICRRNSKGGAIVTSKGYFLRPLMSPCKTHTHTHAQTHTHTHMHTYHITFLLSVSVSFCFSLSLSPSFSQSLAEQGKRSFLVPRGYKGRGGRDRHGQRWAQTPPGV